MSSIGDDSLAVALFPHDPLALIPLLQSHLPRSLPVHTLIACNYHLANPTSGGGHANSPADNDDVHNKAWATFPDLSDIPVLFVVLIHVPGPPADQIRFFCSAESHASSEEERQAASAMVQHSVRSFQAISKEMKAIGGLSILWSGAVRDMWRSPNPAAIYEIWVAPVPGDSDKQNQEDLVDLIVDGGRREDCEEIQANRGIPFPIEYYISRLPYTTVIRTLTEPRRAVGWLLENSGGDLGSLHILPAYRRRGLAKRLAQERIKAQQLRGVRSHVWVSRENVASQAFWSNLGWEKGWSAEWVR